MIPEEDILAEIDRLADGDSPPTIEEFEDSGKYASGTVVNRFDSWNNGLRKAGYEPNKEQSIPDEDLLAEINRLADGDLPPTAPEFNRKGKYGTNTILRRFGSWNAGVKKAGYEPNVEKNISGENLLAEIHRLADGDSPPTVNEFNKKSEHDTTTVQRRFGGWNTGLRKAGYEPNKEHSIPDETLLEQLRTEIQGEIAPQRENFNGRYHTSTYERRFGSWWRAVVRARIQPASRRPLTSNQFRQFFETAKAQKQPKRELTTLLIQFTGLTRQLLPYLSTSWLTNRAGDILVRVPEEQTQSGDRWTFQVPSSWSDAGTQRETGLPGLLQWYFEHYDSIYSSDRHFSQIVLQVADDAGLTNREHVTRDRIGTVPLVRPSDLRVTGGVRMARNGAPTHRIRRHLGIGHTNWKASVEDFFVWCEVHDDNFSHPDWDGFR